MDYLNMSLAGESSPALATVGELGCSGHLIIQLNSSRSSKQLWDVGPGPQAPAADLASL